MKRTAALIGLLLCASLANAEALHDVVLKGATDRSVTVKIIDSTTGVPSTDIVFNSAGIDLWYRREGAASVDVTEATLAALTTAHTDGGFLHVNDGVYRLDLPDAAFATGANYVDFGGIVTGEIVIGGRVRLVNANLEDAVRLGLTALPNAAADAAGGLPISDAGGLDLDTLAANIAAILVDTGTTLDDLVDDLEARLGTPSNLGGGATVAANLSDIEGQTDDIGTAGAGLTNIDLPNQTMDITGSLSGSVGSVTGAVGSVTGNVGGNVTGSVGSIASAGLTSLVNAVLLGQGIPAPTTIATLASQTSFTLTAGSADDNAYNGYGIIVRDVSTAAQQALGCVRDYTGSTRTVTLLADPAIFTMATTDNVQLLPAYCDAQVMQDLLDSAFLNCTVDTANFAGSTTTLACDLTDQDGAAVTLASGDLTGLEIRILSGAQKHEGRFINSTTWDGANSELQITLSRALPATLADAVIAIIR